MARSAGVLGAKRSGAKCSRRKTFSTLGELEKKDRNKPDGDPSVQLPEILNATTVPFKHEAPNIFVSKIR